MKTSFKVLIIKMSSLGDVLQTTHLVSSIKKSYPDCRIDFMTGENCALLLKNNTSLRRVISVRGFDRSGIQAAFISLFRFLKLGLLLFSERYDYIIVLHRHFAFKCFGRLITYKKVIAWGPPSLFFKTISFDLNNNRYDRHFDLVDKYLPLSIRDFNLTYIQNFSKPDISSPYIVIAPGGGHNNWASMPNKLWPLSGFQKLIAQMPVDYKIVLVGAKTDKNICEQLSSKKILNLCDKTSIVELADVIKFADLFIGNDSFAYYLACAVGTKALGLFGPTNPEILVPQMKNAFYLQSANKCLNCYNPIDSIGGLAYKCKNNDCLKLLEAETVKTKVLDILDKKQV
ncbi:MAG: glycosyltransferase family 9 protein [Candidatus Margulisbacteria bacterium]|nr:glycosyltransferase family 9 protein [Candidatus Margulisiibacteriota bacterium]